MSGPKQWDISKAVVIASSFSFLHNVGNFCVLPFLTLFFRNLGLNPPLVGILMGAKHMVFALWAPFCSLAAKTNSKRRIVITSSLLLSAVAGLILTVYPPLSRDVVFRLCNASLPGTNGPTTPSAIDFELFAPDDNGTFTMPEPPLMSTQFTRLRSKTLMRNSTLEAKVPHQSVRKTLMEKSTLEAKVPHQSVRKTLMENAPLEAKVPHQSVRKTLMEKSTLEAKVPHKTFRNMETTTDIYPTTSSDISKTLPNGSTDSLGKLEDRPTAGDLLALNLEPRTSSVDANGIKSLAWTPQVDPYRSAPGSPAQTEFSSHFETKKRDFGKIPSQASYFSDVEILKIFAAVLAIVVVWEIFASPLEWTADDSLYEYLDFVDATDQHERVWIWRYLGACLGSCFIVVLVDNLNCFLTPHVPKIYLHFYFYTAFTFFTLLLSVLYPIHVSKNAEHASKTVKALGLMASDGRIVLLAVTLFLMGAVRSTTYNFLFWQMQDMGSSEFFMGLSVSVALLSEVVLHVFKNKLVRFLSYKSMVVLALLCQAVQFLHYSFLWAPWAVLPVQLLGAFSNEVLLWAVKSQVDDVATPGTERSIQLLLHCLSHHCGASLGSFAGGFVIGSFGLSVLYWACCLTLLVWLVLFLIIQPQLPHVKKINYSRLLAPDNSDMSDSEDEQERDWLVKAMKDDSKVW